MISLDQLNQLPIVHRQTIPESYLDVMGHMNIRWYVAIYDDAAWNFFESLGMTHEHYLQSNNGMFALQQFISYLAEVHVGETVSVRTRILGRSAKRIHFMHFMVNETTGVLASTMEVLGSHADTQLRRTSPFPDDIAQVIDGVLASHHQLDWSAPVCGVIRP